MEIELNLKNCNKEKLDIIFDQDRAVRSYRYGEPFSSITLRVNPENVKYFSRIKSFNTFETRLELINVLYELSKNINNCLKIDTVIENWMEYLISHYPELWFYLSKKSNQTDKTLIMNYYLFYNNINLMNIEDLKVFLDKEKDHALISSLCNLLKK